MSTAPQTLTDEDVIKLLIILLSGFGTEQRKKKSVRNYTMAVLMLDAGLRVGEVVQIHAVDLWFNNAPVTSVLIPAKIAKNNQTRQIPVSVRLSNALKEMYQCYWSKVEPFGSYRAFYNSNPSESLTTRQVERIIRSASMKALGYPIHPHMLRHTFASNLMRITNIRTVQELLGHKHLTSTQVYTHPNENDKIKAIACMQDVCVDTTSVLDRLRTAARTPD